MKSGGQERSLKPDRRQQLAAFSCIIGQLKQTYPFSALPNASVGLDLSTDLPNQCTYETSDHTPPGTY